MARDWRLDRRTWQEFESLVGHLCNEVLGTGTVVFSDGPDGGRDGRFSGVANNFPSSSDPWFGEWVIQAKHTTDRSASCSDGSFYGNRTSELQKEIPKLKRLREEDGIDCYLLVTNRALAAGRHEELRKIIQTETGVTNVHLVGLETLSGFLDRHPFLAELAGLNHILGPLRFGSRELQAIIEAFGELDTPRRDGALVEDPAIAAKNEKNRLSDRYFAMIEQRYAPYFHQVRTFLRDPMNVELARKYEVLSAELNAKIMARRDEYDRFDHVFPSLYDRALELAPELSERGNLVWLFLHFMYWDCDVGEA